MDLDLWLLLAPIWLPWQGAASAFAMSAVLAQKAAATTKILDSHRQNMSLEAGTVKQKQVQLFGMFVGVKTSRAVCTLKATIGRVMEVWRPICLKAHVFSCDEGNFWDLHYASHRQTMALMQTGPVFSCLLNGRNHYFDQHGTRRPPI